MFIYGSGQVEESRLATVPERLVYMWLCDTNTGCLLVHSPTYPFLSNMSYSSESHMTNFNLINGYPGDIIPVSLKDPFTLRTAAVTDLWRKPQGVEVYNAPSLVKTVRIEEFKSARVTIGAGWVRLYDQGGLVLYFHDSKLNAGGE